MVVSPPVGLGLKDTVMSSDVKDTELSEVEECEAWRVFMMLEKGPMLEKGVLLMTLWRKDLGVLLGEAGIGLRLEMVEVEAAKAKGLAPGGSGCTFFKDGERPMMG